MDRRIGNGSVLAALHGRAAAIRENDRPLRVGVLPRLRNVADTKALLAILEPTWETKSNARVV